MPTDSGYNTIAAWALAICRALQETGVDPQPLLARAELDYEQLIAAPDGRVAIDKMTMLWQQAEAVTENPAFGLSIARFVQPMHLRALGMVVLTCDNMLQAIDKLASYYALVSNTVRVRVIHEPDRVGFVVDTLASVPISPLAIDSFFSTLQSFAQQISGFTAPVCHVELVQSLPRDPAPWQKHFLCPVAFSSQTNCLWFQRKALLASRIVGDPNLMQATENVVKRYLQDMQAISWQQRVEQYLRATLASGEPSLAEIAREFHLSERSLRRFLQEEGSSFRQCVQSVKQELACHLLTESNTPVAEIAERVGFSDSSNFNRAFQRWMRVTPKEYREKKAQNKNALCRSTLEPA